MASRAGVSWTSGEDAELRALTERLGDKDWCMIASVLKTRTARQCRERYKNHVKPCLSSSACPCLRLQLMLVPLERVSEHACAIAHMPQR